MLQRPFLAQCNNRDARPQSNVATGSPEEWFDNSVLDKLGLIAFSFDFFVNWSRTPFSITPYIWVKRIMNVNPESFIDNGEVKVQDIAKAIINLEGEEYLRLFASFCKNKGLILQYLIFRDTDWAISQEMIFVATVSSYEQNLKFDIEAVNLDALKTLIKNNSGGPVKMGDKGLVYSTSKLECFLSQTDSLYPGDVDLVVVSKDTLAIRAILEFKKHTQASPIEDQTLTNYYPYPDKRKYDRLAILKRFLFSVPKMICIYYPTKSSMINGKIELIEDHSSNLVPGRSSIICLPQNGQIASYQEFVEKTLTL